MCSIIWIDDGEKDALRSIFFVCPPADGVYHKTKSIKFDFGLAKFGQLE